MTRTRSARSLVARACLGLLLVGLGLGGGCDDPASGATATPSVSTAPVVLSTLERLEAAVVTAPEDAAAWSELARERLGADDTDGAAEAATRALELSDAPSADDANTLAEAHAAAERWEEARAALAQVIELDPERPGAQIELGRMQEHLDDPEAAEVAYRAAIDLDDDDVEARMRIASLLIARSRRAILAESGEASRAEATAMLEAARAHLDENDPREGAIAAYEEELGELESAAETRRAERELELTEMEAQIIGILGGDPGGSDLILAGSGASMAGLDAVMAQRQGGVGVASASRGGSLGGGRVGGLGSIGSRPAPSPAPQPSVSVRVTAGSSGGLQTGVVTRVASMHGAAFRRCHTTAAQREPTLSGAVAVHLTITNAGVAQAANASGPVRDEALRACVRGVVMRMAFPTAEGPSRATITATFHQRSE